MFQLKFYLNTFETYCSLLYFSVHKFSILAIVLFEYLLLDQRAKRWFKLSRGLKISGVHESPVPYFPRHVAPSCYVTLIQQCFKRHGYVAANNPFIVFLKAHFFLFFFRQVNRRYYF